MSKAATLREKTDLELSNREIELVEQLYKLRFQRETGSLENPLKMRQVRKEIARIKTVLREREMAGSES
jgi:large subunit ribosomal protein L29